MPKVKNFRFPKFERLLRPAEFRAVFRSGQRQNTALLTVISCQNSVSTARLGLAISKKNVRRAVDRNRIKRIIREWFRMNKENLAGKDVVVMARPAINRANNKELLMALEQATRMSRQK